MKALFVALLALGLAAPAATQKCEPITGIVIVYRMKFALAGSHLDSVPVYVDGLKDAAVDHGKHVALSLLRQ